MKAFLFTDIESSTRPWEEHPGEMANALERHDAIMRDSITAGDGRAAEDDRRWNPEVLERAWGAGSSRPMDWP